MSITDLLALDRDQWKVLEACVWDTSNIPVRLNFGENL